jgi:hypothetical protein
MGLEEPVMALEVIELESEHARCIQRISTDSV